MLPKTLFSMTLVLGWNLTCWAENNLKPKPTELEPLQASVGVWNAEIEVWPEGPDSPSLKFRGVETNRAYGDYWIVSDFDSEYMGQTMKVHSIVGYDLDREKMVGLVVDHGPYSASMTGTYDETTKTVHWQTTGKNPSGQPLVQKTTVTQKSPEERVLILSVPGEEAGEFRKFMQIKFIKRK